jgi:hypothetical protein
MQQLAADPYLWPLALLMIGTAASVAGGALGGFLVGGRDLGRALAATMGACFGPLAGVSGIALGLLALTWLG